VAREERATWPFASLDFMLNLSPSCAENGSKPEATMSNTKRFAIVASVGIVSLGSITSQAQQQPPQSPNMTFFVTRTGPGKGADLGGLEGADR
jgi:hypothetical protein